MDPTHNLDGSSAGGQFFRTALTLAALEGESVRIENIRGNRSNPGLKAQHLAVLETLAEICDADVSGGELGSETVTFDPETISGGHYAVDIGTAGSVTLVFQALLPLASRLEEPLVVRATGGTDVAWSPPVDYLRYVTLPLCRQIGLQAAVEVDRRGFYPAGGGHVSLRLAPSTLRPVDLAERGRLEGVRVYSTESSSLAESDVATRQAGGALERLTATLDESGLDLTRRERVETTADSAGPGSVIVLRLEGASEEHDESRIGDEPVTRAGFSALGEPGKPAERVGEDAADAAGRFLESTAAVDRHMADQVLVFLAIAGGRVRIPTVTDHVESSCALLAEMGYELDLTLEDDGNDGGTGDERLVSSEPPS